MFTFCDVLHEIQQDTQTNSRECAVRTGNPLLIFHWYILRYKSEASEELSQKRFNYFMKNGDISCLILFLSSI